MGHDRARMAVSAASPGAPQQDVDKIQDFLNARYVSVCESLYRIFRFSLHNHTLNI
ncbi:hypothetical protein BGZ51_006443, partial [Haplosporangium sp. Z 767]